jgi:hypothetical protein
MQSVSLGLYPTSEAAFANKVSPDNPAHRNGTDGGQCF